MRRYVLVAENQKAASAFAKLNGMKPSEYYIGRNARVLDGKRNLTAIFIDGWRARKDALAMVQAVNSAEIRGVKLVDARPGQVLDLKKG